MTDHVQRYGDDAQWAVIAQAEGIVAARDDVSVTEAAARLRADAQAFGVPVSQLAEDLVEFRRAKTSDDR